MTAALALLAVFAGQWTFDGRQVEPREKRVADLLQLTVELAETIALEDRSRSLTTLTADMAALRSCADAERLAARYQREKTFTATIVRRSDVAIRWMPPNLQDELLGLPVGHATSIFGDRASPRILIACTAPRLLPNGTTPPAP